MFGNVHANSILWTSTDTRNVILNSIVPTGLGLYHYMSSKPGGSYNHVFERSRKPDYLQYPSQLFGAFDLLTMAPLGYASYVVYRNGGGFDNPTTKAALGLYGLTILLTSANVYLYENRNLSGLSKNKVLLALSAIATSVAFYRIDQTAGILCGIFAAATAGCAFSFCHMCQKND